MLSTPMRNSECNLGRGFRISYLSDLTPQFQADDSRRLACVLLLLLLLLLEEERWGERGGGGGGGLPCLACHYTVVVNQSQSSRAELIRSRDAASGNTYSDVTGEKGRKGGGERKKLV